MRPFVFGLVAAVAAFGLRLGFTAAYRGGLDQPPTYARCASDGLEYDLFARNVAAGRGYCWEDGSPTSFRAPGFPLAMAAVFAVFGVSYPAIHVFFAACGAASVVGTYLFARELMGDLKARWVAALAAIYPPDIYMASNFLSEIPFVPALAFGLWLLVRHRRTGEWWTVLVAGLLLGYGSLCRSFAILLLPALGVYTLGNPVRRVGWTGAALYGVGFLAAVLPWTARNYHVHGRVVLVATNGGSTFYGANNPVVAGSIKEYGNWVATNRLPGRDLIDAQPDEVSHDQMEWKLGIEWVKAHPLDFAKLAVFKLARAWAPFVHWNSTKVNPIANVVCTAPFLLLITVGLIRTGFTWSGWRQYAVCHLTLLATLVMVVIFWGEPRFRDANMPVLMIYAVAGGGWIVRRVGRRIGWVG